MPVERKLAQKVVDAFRAAGRPIGDVDFIARMWNERQAQEKLAELAKYGKKAQPKASAPAPAIAGTKNPEDPTKLPAMKFRDFIEDFPRETLKEHGVKKYQMSAVGLVMSNHCDYYSGTQMKLTAKAISDRSGISHRGVVAVLALLESVGAIEKTRSIRHPKGSPSAEYMFVRSDFVTMVLDSTIVGEQSTVVGGQSAIVHEQTIRLQDSNPSVAIAPSVDQEQEEAEGDFEEEEEVWSLSLDEQFASAMADERS